METSIAGLLHLTVKLAIRTHLVRTVLNFFAQIFNIFAGSMSSAATRGRNGQHHSDQGQDQTLSDFFHISVFVFWFYVSVLALQILS